ncbi:M23 family metallopeptidase [Psychromicrobium xiongbiense]|uniref:M23 family metallopeptidase n=1 Tax=Psychromicrobium xiongbiense TaxID=3051184 RepID=UPI003075CD29
MKTPVRSAAWAVAILGIALLVSLSSLVAAPVALASSSSASSSAQKRWQWPLRPQPAVVRSFDPPAKPWLAGHRGVDLQAAIGDQVHSPAAGVVSFVGWVVDRNVLTIDHGNGLRSSFEPVSASVTEGDHVTAGQAIGTVEASSAASGHCPGQGCLHWGVRRGSSYLDPLLFLGNRSPSVLLPLKHVAASAGSQSQSQSQTMAEMPVMARPVTRELISWVPS